MGSKIYKFQKRIILAPFLFLYKVKFIYTLLKFINFILINFINRIFKIFFILIKNIYNINNLSITIFYPTFYYSVDIFQIID
jgi:hypothetical protein